MNRSAALRASILVSLGLLPIACSGRTTTVGDEDLGSAGSSGASGTGSVAMAGSAGQVTGTGGAVTGTSGAPTNTGGVLTGTGGGSGGAGAALCTPGRFDGTTQLVHCADQGYYTRPMAGRCPAGADVGGDEPGERPRADGTTPCQSHEECRGYALGYCGFYASGGCVGGLGGAPAPSGLCRSGCTTDADCNEDALCVCGGDLAAGTCVNANCRTDADCGVGSVCASVEHEGWRHFRCTRPNDECTSATDCSASQFCSFVEESGRRSCVSRPACGRPFLVESKVRLAEAVPSQAWLEDALSPQVSNLSTEERAALALHWTKLGQMEHASIAAFARFQLQLLALGAPADLVQACNQALVDETAHTRVCFALASAYAGRGIGPGPLDVSHSLDVTSLADIVELVLVEGCFGETSAALDALEAAESATDPVVRGVYARIAADEQRHAELAFRFVRWALRGGDDGVAERVRDAIARPPTTSREALAVTVPCLRALLGQPPSALGANVCQRESLAS